MIALLLAFASMIVLAIYAQFRIAPGRSRLPMQWSATGEVRWEAPRVIALAFIPGLAAVIVAILLIAGLGHRWELVMIAWLLFISQGFHLWLVHRHIAKPRP
jgi:hypothetical protein